MKSEDQHITQLKSRIRAPILWIILPLISGYLAARLTPSLSPLLFFSLGLALSAIWLALWCKRLHRSLYSKALGLCSIFILSWGYLLWHLPPSLNWQEKPQREAILTLKVTQTQPLEDKYQRQNGYAEILDAPTHLKSLIGQKVSFFLSPENTNAPPLIRSQIIKTRSLITPINPNLDNSFENYLFSQGITFKLYRGHILETLSQPSKFFTFCKKQNDHLTAILSQGQNKENPNASKIYHAMLLGNQASLTPDQKYAFKMTGSLHLFSISGLHVAIIAACIAFFLKLIKIPNALAALIGLSILFLYVEITGGSPSAMRAFLMVAFYWGAKAFKRKTSAFSALLASGLISLLANPFDLWNIGFQLSYTVVATILLYGVPLNEIINTWINHRFQKSYFILINGLRWLLNLIGISLAANIGSTFLSTLYFKIFSPGAVILSIVVIPLASITIVIGCISLLFGLIGLSIISRLLNPISEFIIKIMETPIFWSLKIPGFFLESLQTPSLLLHISLISLLTILYLGHLFNKLQNPIFYSLPLTIITLFAGLEYLL